MGVLYSLYDALVSINVPSEKALAVADAMEQDMLEKLATKADLALVRQELSSLKDSLTKDMSALEARLEHKMDILGAKLTIHLGGLMVVLLGVMYMMLQYS